MRKKYLFPVDIENQAIAPGLFGHILKVYVQHKQTETNMQSGSSLRAPLKLRNVFCKVRNAEMGKGSVKAELIRLQVIKLSVQVLNTIRLNNYFMRVFSTQC